MSLNTRTARLVQFLQDELAVPSDSIPYVLEQCKNPSRLAVVLWQQKLVNLTQLDLLLNWLERYLAETI